MPISINTLSIIFAEAFDNLNGVKQRTFLSFVGILVGAASVVALINIGENASVESTRHFRTMGTDILVVQGGISTPTAGRSIRLEDLKGIPKAIGSMSIPAAFSICQVQIWFNGKTVFTSAVGGTPELFKLARLNLKSGRFISKFDDNSTFVIIGNALAKSLGTNDHPINTGDKIRIDDYVYDVVGVLDSMVRNPLVMVDFNDSLIMPIKSIRRTLSTNGDISSALIKVPEGKIPSDVAKKVSEFLILKTGNIEIQTQSAEQLIEGLKKQTQVFTLLLAGIGAISLIVGGIGIMNVMLSGLAERRREIGVRMAIGARRQDILIMIMLESILLTIIGGLFGTTLGLFVSYFFALFSGWEFSLSPISLVTGLFMSVFVGLFLGIYPAIRASKLSPITALNMD